MAAEADRMALVDRNQNSGFKLFASKEAGQSGQLCCVDFEQAADRE